MRNLAIFQSGNERAACSIPGQLLPAQKGVVEASEERRRALPQPASAATCDSDESTFLELRRKVQSGELLSATTERILRKMKFNGHLTVVVQHGTIVKSGYEEGYFRRRNDLGGALLRG